MRLAISSTVNRLTAGSRLGGRGGCCLALVLADGLLFRATRRLLLLSRYVLLGAVRRSEALIVRNGLRYAGVGHALSVPTYTTRSELFALYLLAARCPVGATALELGSYLGASTCIIAAGLAQVGGHLVCVDTWNNETMPEGERDTLAEFLRNTRAVSRMITVLRMRTSDLTRAHVPNDLRLVFIDADHEYLSVKGDFERIAPWVAEGGVVAFHDCRAFVGVSRVIGEALATGDWWVDGHVNNLLWIRRALRSPRVSSAGGMHVPSTLPDAMAPVASPDRASETGRG